MDAIVYPEMRKWISKKINLGETADELHLQAKALEESVKVCKVMVPYEPPGFSNSSYTRADRIIDEHNRDSNPSLSLIEHDPPRNEFVNKIRRSERFSRKKTQRDGDIANPLPSSSKVMQETGTKARQLEVLPTIPSGIEQLLGDDTLYYVKTKEKAHGKRGLSRDDTVDSKEEEIGHLLNLNIFEDVYEEESDDFEESYDPPSVEDYFSNFSELNESSGSEEEDSDECYDGADDTFQFKNLCRRLEVAAGSSKAVGNEPSQSQLLKNTQISKLKKEFLEVAQTQFPSSNENNYVEDLKAGGHPPQSTSKSAGQDECFKSFVDRVLKCKQFKYSDFGNTHKDKIAQRLGISEEEFKKLMGKINPARATCRGETFQDKSVVEELSMPVLTPPLSTSAKSKLQSLAIFVTHGDDPTGFQWKSNNVQQQMNDDMLHLSFVKKMEEQRADYAEQKKGLVDKEKDFMVQVTVYQAGDPDETLPEEVKGRPSDGRPGCRRKIDPECPLTIPNYGSTRYVEPKSAFKLDILGSQTLAQLRDVLHCENDLLSVKDVQSPNNYHPNPANLSGNVYRQAMLLIEDTIYSDMKNPNSIDYAEMLNKWAKNPPTKNIGPFTKGDLEETKIRDLTIRFGYPYVFIHMANCEHIVVFNKARLLEVEDEHKLANYPLLTLSSSFKSIYCRVDNEYLASWAVLDYEEFPDNPMLICTECLKMYCYDQKGEKRGKFRLFPFQQMASEF